MLRGDFDVDLDDDDGESTGYARLLKQYRLDDPHRNMVTPVLNIYESRYRGAGSAQFCCLRGGEKDLQKHFEAIADPNSYPSTKKTKLESIQEKVRAAVESFFKDEPRTASIRSEDCSMMYYCHHPDNVQRRGRRGRRERRGRANPDIGLKDSIARHVEGRLQKLDEFKLQNMCIYSHFYEYPQLVKNVLSWLDILIMRALQQVQTLKNTETGVLDCIALAIGTLSWLIYGWDRKITPWKGYFLSSSGKPIRDLLTRYGMVCDMPVSLLCGGVRSSFNLGNDRCVISASIQGRSFSWNMLRVCERLSALFLVQMDLSKHGKSSLIHLSTLLGETTEEQDSSHVGKMEICGASAA